VRRIEDIDVVVGTDIASGDHTRALLGQAQGGRIAGVHADRDILEVEQHLEHVFLQAFDRGVFVQHAVDLDFGDREAGDRGQQHAAQRVAEGVAVAAFQRLDHDLGAVLGDALDLRTARAQDLVGGNRHVSVSPVTIALACDGYCKAFGYFE
jgi:hypothetical protein